MSYDISHQPESMQKLYNELPEEVVELFEYGSVDKIIEESAKEFGLGADESQSLRMEVELVLYCILPKNGLTERIQESLNVDIEKARQISSKIDRELFIIVDGLLEAAGMQFSEDTAEILTPTIVVPPVTNAQPSTTPTDTDTKTEDKTQLKPLRTFAMDVDVSRAHGYGAFRSGEDDDGDEPVHHSSQDDIIKK